MLPAGLLSGPNHATPPARTPAPTPARPQLYNVVKSGSAEGLSPLSFELETAGLLVHTSYGYINGLAFSAYGWVPACARVRVRICPPRTRVRCAAQALPTCHSASFAARTALRIRRAHPRSCPPAPLPLLDRSDALVLWAQNLVLLLLIYQLQRVSAVRTALALGVITAYAAAAFTGGSACAPVRVAT